MVLLKFLAGGSISFIASYLFDTDAKTLTLLQQNPSGTNPTWIERSIVNPSVLYAVNELEAGAVQSFTIFENGTLSGANSSASTGGNGPAHVFASKEGLVSAMNFGGGNGAIFHMQNNESVFGDPQVITFPVVSSHNASHPHETLQLDDELFVPDLGGDTIWRLAPDQNGNFSIVGQITQPAGSGPRHAAIYNDFLVTVHELSNTITSQRIPPLGQNSSDLISNLSTVPSNQVALLNATFAAAEVLIPLPNGSFNTTMVYVSNRNTGSGSESTGDSIAIFTLDADGTLNPVSQIFTGLQQVRGMQFGGPDDRYLVASGVVGDGGVIVFERLGQGDQLVPVASNKDIPRLTSFVWI